MKSFRSDKTPQCDECATSVPTPGAFRPYSRQHFRFHARCSQVHECQHPTLHTRYRTPTPLDLGSEPESGNRWGTYGKRTTQARASHFWQVGGSMRTSGSASAQGYRLAAVHAISDGVHHPHSSRRCIVDARGEYNFGYAAKSAERRLRPLWPEPTGCFGMTRVGQETSAGISYPCRHGG